MENKPRFNQKQALAFERFTQIREGFAIQAFKDGRPFEGEYQPLNTIHIDEFAKALYGGGYELKEDEEEYWAAMGREVAEFRHGDIFIDKNGNDVEGTPEYAAFLYERGDFAGLYPAESFRPYGKDVRQMKFNVGDKLIIANAGGIMFGKDYFKDGDVTEVLQVEEYPFGESGEQCIDVAVPEDKVDRQTDFIDGKPALYITSEEFAHIVKVLPDNKGGS